MTKLYRGAAFVVLAVVVSVLFLGGQSRTDAVAETAKVGRGTVLRRAMLAGLVVPGSRSTVAPTTAGRVIAVLVSLGDRVAAGQPLVRLDSARLETDLRKRTLSLGRAEIRLAQAQSRADATHDDNAIALERIGVEEATIDRDAVRRELEATVLRAGSAGTVVQLAVREGDVLSPLGGGGVAPIMIAMTSSLVVEVEGDEFEVSEVRRGQHAVVFVDAVHSGPLEAEVLDDPTPRRYLVGATTNAVFGFKLKLNETLDMRLAGMSARAEVELARQNDALIAPNRAVLSADGRDYLLVREGRTARQVAIQAGISDAYVTELVRGPKEGTVIEIPAAGARK